LRTSSRHAFTRSIFSGALLASVLFATTGAWLGAVAAAPDPISRDTFLQRVTVGMTKEQVRDAIGMPLHFAAKNDHPLGQGAYWFAHTIDQATGKKDFVACVVIDTKGTVAKVFFVGPLETIEQLSEEEACAIGAVDTVNTGDCEIDLQKLGSLTPKVAQRLVESANAGYDARFMREQAERQRAFPQFGGDPGPNPLPSTRPLLLGKVRTLTADVAKQLAQYKGPLVLPAVSELSDETAEVLGSHRGISLYLSGVTSLSESAAAALAKHTPFTPRPVVDISGLTAWEHRLSLSGLVSLTPAQAAALSRYYGWLDLSGVRELTPAASKALGEHRGGLDLSGIEELSPDSAAGLVQPPPQTIVGTPRRDGYLTLCGLKTLSPQTARALNAHWTERIVPHEIKLSADAIAEIGDRNRRGHWRFRTRGGSDRSPVLPDEAVEGLVSHKTPLLLMSFDMSHAAWLKLKQAGHDVGSEPDDGRPVKGSWRRAYEGLRADAAAGSGPAHERAEIMWRRLTDRGITLDDMDWGERLLRDRGSSLEGLPDRDREKYRKVLDVLAR